MEGAWPWWSPYDRSELVHVAVSTWMMVRRMSGIEIRSVVAGGDVGNCLVRLTRRVARDLLMVAMRERIRWRWVVVIFGSRTKMYKLRTVVESCMMILSCEAGIISKPRMDASTSAVLIEEGTAPILVGT